MVTINLYKQTEKKNVINKSIPAPLVVSGLLYEHCDILNPIVKLRHSGVFKYNYVYIAEFTRYYFIDSVTQLDNNTVEINLSVDVLKTYSDLILGLNGTLEISENSSKYISTRSAIYNIQPNFEKLVFPQGEFYEEGSLIMVTIKGKL